MVKNIVQKLQELNVTKIKFKPLETMCNILDSQRIPVTKKNRISGKYPYYGANGIQDYVNEYIFDGVFLLMGEDGSVINKDNSPILTWATGKIWVNNHAHILSEKEGTSLRFLYYYLQTVDVSSIVRGTPPKINQQNMRNILIPDIPLPVQNEIVRILDNFAELTAELTARKRQYEYYRNELLCINNCVEYKTLPDISVNFDKQRKAVTKGNRTVGKYPYYGASGIVDYVADYIFEGDYLLISEDGANLLARNTPIAFSISGKNWVNNHAHVIKFETEVMRRYVEFYLNSMDLGKYISGGAQPKLNQENLNKIPIPIPRFEQITQIVNILTQFDALCNDLTSGLPAEIEARQKQYEYYRDKLLTFKEKTI